MSMTKEKALNTIATLLQHTETDCDYAYDNADGSVDLLPGQDITDALRLAITALREQEERRWISVTERMPEENGIYLTFNKKKQYEFHLFQTGKRMWQGIWEEDGVTHWMPMPEPVKEGV